MADFGIAASELESVARHLRLAGQLELARELQKAMNRAVAPVKKEILANLKPALPDRYAETLAADLALRTASFGGASPSVTVTGKPKVKARKLRHLDAGLLTHPVYGNREVWRTQDVQPGWFSGPCEHAAPRVREEILQALDDVAVKAASKGA